MRLIDSDGGQLGVVPVQDAMKKAIERELDLVEVAPQASPPVCKIMDYGKYKYQQSKKQSHKKTMTVKEIKLRPRIGDNDLALKVRKIRQFLDDGNKTKVTMLFRGREIVRHDLGLKVFDKLMDILTGNFSVEQRPQREGRNITMLLAPKSGSGKPKSPAAAPKV